MTLYRGGGLSPGFCTSRTLPSCSCLAISAQETLAFDVLMVDDSNRFCKSNTVCAVRYANFAGELLQKRRFHPISAESARQGEQALPTAMTLGNRKADWFKSGRSSPAPASGSAEMSSRRVPGPTLSYEGRRKMDSVSRRVARA